MGIVFFVQELPELDDEEEEELLELDDEEEGQDLQQVLVPPQPFEQEVVPQEHPVWLESGVQQALQDEYFVEPPQVQDEAPEALPQEQDL